MKNSVTLSDEFNIQVEAEAKYKGHTIYLVYNSGAGWEPRAWTSDLPEDWTEDDHDEFYTWMAFIPRPQIRFIDVDNYATEVAIQEDSFFEERPEVDMPEGDLPF